MEIEKISFPISLLLFLCCCSVAKSCPTLRPHKLQPARLPCPSLSPRVSSDSCPLSWRCCLTISFSAAHFSFCLQSFPASGSFPVSQHFALGSRIPWMEEPGRLQSMGSQRIRHNRATEHSLFAITLHIIEYIFVVQNLTLKLAV